MERIQQALERVKQPQVQQGEVVTASSSLRDTVPDPIRYSGTKTRPSNLEDLVARRVLTSDQHSPFVDAYKILRTQVLHRLKEHRWNVIGVTSPGAQEGKTIVAVNLAISLALEPNHTALLIDANLRNPQIHQLFDVDNYGLADYLLDQVSVSELLIHPEIDRLVVMPAGGPVKISVETLTLAKMTTLVQELKHRYTSRIVVFDLPPVLDTADVIGIAPRLDALILVVEEGKTTEKRIREALASVRETVPVLGVVMNKAGRLSGGVSS